MLRERLLELQPNSCAYSEAERLVLVSEQILTAMMYHRSWLDMQLGARKVSRCVAKGADRQTT